MNYVFIFIILKIGISNQNEYLKNSLKLGKVTKISKQQFNDFLPQFKHLILFPENEKDNDFQEIADQIHEKYKDPVFVIVQGYNSLQVYEKEKQIVYRNQILQKQEILDFILDIIKRDLHKIQNRKDFDKFIKIKDKNKVLFVSEQKNLQEVLMKLIDDDVFAMSGNYEIGLCTDQSIIPYPDNIQIENMVLYKDQKDLDDLEDEGVHIYQDNLLNIEEILNFLNINSLKLVNYLNDQNIIFGAQLKKQLLVFINEKEDNKKLIETIKKLAIYNKKEETFIQRLIFSIIVNNEENKEFFEYFGANYQQLPKIFGSEAKSSELLKYEFTDEINFENLKKFIENFRNKNVKIAKKSEYLEDQTNFDIKKMNYENFQKEIINNKQNQIILFYTQLDDVREHSDLALKLLKILQLKVKPINHNLTFYTYDIVKNDFYDLNLQQTPELRIYLKGEKKNPRIFKYEFTLKKVFEFYNVYFDQNEIKMTYEEEDQLQLSLMAEKDRQSILNARKRREESEGPQKVNKDNVVFQKWTRYDYESGINPLYKGDQNMFKIDPIEEKIEEL